MSSLSITSLATLSAQSMFPPALAPRAATSTPAMGDIPGYADLRDCVRVCVDGHSYGESNIYGDVGCGTYSCVCRSDMLSSALQQVSSCISGGCQDNESDQAAATSMVNAYCSISPDADTTESRKGAGPTTITISKTIITTDGATVTSAVPPMVTVVTQGSPDFYNIINDGNGNGNAGNGNGNRNKAGSLSISSLLAGTIGLGSLLMVLVIM